jgi:protein-disulfide isomerase-like protein with CxxC motif
MLSDNNQLTLSSMNQRILNAERQALRSQRSSIRGYFGNFRVQENQERRYYHRKAKLIAKMTECLDKLHYLHKRDDSLSVLRELYQVVGLPTTELEQQWNENRQNLQSTVMDYNRLLSQWNHLEQQ